jgi:hypothetical protein
MHTKHASARIQQRRIPSEAIALLLDYGDVLFDKHGAEIVSLTKRSLRRLAHNLDRTVGQRADEYRRRGLYLVLGKGGVVTCGYRTKHLRRG